MHLWDFFSQEALCCLTVASVNLGLTALLSSEKSHGQTSQPVVAYRLNMVHIIAFYMHSEGCLMCDTFHLPWKETLPIIMAVTEKSGAKREMTEL